MSIIKAPFNFVPLNQEVYTPHWADRISHDIPFSDGLSGEIEVEIEAKTPIFIRGGHERDIDKDSKEYKEFSNINGHYYIPGTSIKGMIRNIVEIMSFSKMPVDERKRYAQRDWENTTLYNLRNIAVQNTIRCGWLKRIEENNEVKYQVTDCGKPLRINHKEIDKILGQDAFLEKYFRDTSNVDLDNIIEKDGKKFNPKTATFKYSFIKKQSILKNYFLKGTSQNNRYLASVNETATSGTIVFTGQSGPWKFPRNNVREGKFYEFIFPDPQRKELKYISEDTFNQYAFFMKDSDDWKMWTDVLNDKDGEMPIFFRADRNCILDFGLAYMYKLPYKRSVAEIVQKFQKSSATDLAECMFGSTTLDGAALKGRVHIGHALADMDTAAENNEEFTLILGSPKASYYPIYINQECNGSIVGEYKTYNDGDIRGWKRYPIKKYFKPNNNEKNEVTSSFIPLKPGVKFYEKIRFHNLKPVELGALLSALTFHGNEKYYHSIGLAKAFGFGNIKINAKLKDEFCNQEKEFMSQFEYEMNTKVGQWINTTQILELFAMADPNRVKEEKLNLLDYMVLSMDGKNDFKAAKTSKEFLKNFTQIFPGSNEVESLSNIYEDKIKKQKAKEEFEQKEKDRIKEEKAAAALKAKQEQEAIIAEQTRIARMIEAQEMGFAPVFESSSNFEDLKKKIATALKRMCFDRIPDDQADLLLPHLQRFLLNSKDRKELIKPFESNHAFKKITTWIGEEKAREFYAKLNNI